MRHRFTEPLPPLTASVLGRAERVEPPRRPLPRSARRGEKATALFCRCRCLLAGNREGGDEYCCRRLPTPLTFFVAPAHRRSQPAAAVQDQPLHRHLEYVESGGRSCPCFVACRRKNREGRMEALLRRWRDAPPQHRQGLLPSEIETADGFAKPLPVSLFRHFVSKLGIQDLHAPAYGGSSFLLFLCLLSLFFIPLSHHPPSLVRTILLHPCLPRFALSSTFSSSDRKDFGFFEDIEISHPRTFVLDIANLCFIRAILDASADVVLDNHWLIHTLPEGDYLGVSLQEIHYVFRMPPPFF
nr:uncharacterized protein LOC109168052 [Ipomoea batatas]